MKLMRLGPLGQETPCVLDIEGIARDVSSIVADFSPQAIPGLREALSGADISALPAVSQDDVRIGSPIARPHNVWCIGLNYSDHAAEAGMPVPEEPILFTKPSSTVCGPNDPIIKAANSTKLDWEVELGVVVSKPALNVALEDAMNYVLGYTVVNDVSERAWQLERGGQWSKGKGYPNFCPTGPVLVTGDELANPGNLAMHLSVNGDQKQNGKTSTMIFDVKTIVSYLSQFCLLEPGDLICTGTPPGVGMGLKPQQYLNVGDNVELDIEGLGSQTQTVVAAGDE